MKRSGTAVVGAAGIVVCLQLACASVWAGNLDAPAAPSDPGSAMYKLEDVYNSVNDGTAAAKRAGGFTEPGSGPTAGTGHTSDQLYNLTRERSRPAKTGQTTGYATGDDGDLEKGVAWPSPRFTDPGNGTVKDNLTGLTWLKNANCWGAVNWPDALTTYTITLANGQCGLTDGSAAGDWRVPNRHELESLLDMSQFSPALPLGHPFTSVQTGANYYWSSTTYASSTTNAWRVSLATGNVNVLLKTTSAVMFVLPVRGGQ